MNKERRKLVKSAYDLMEKAKANIEEALDEEQVCYDSLPEGIQCSDRGSEMEENIEQLQECSDYLDEAMDALDNII